ncbi:hypothetical protein Efla_005777 [Eimeria flavescens]
MLLRDLTILFKSMQRNVERVSRCVSRAVKKDSAIPQLISEGAPGKLGEDAVPAVAREMQSAKQLMLAVVKLHMATLHPAGERDLLIQNVLTIGLVEYRQLTLDTRASSWVRPSL